MVLNTHKCRAKSSESCEELNVKSESCAELNQVNHEVNHVLVSLTSPFYVYLYIIIYLLLIFIFIYLVNKLLSVAGISEDNAQSLLGQPFINHRKAFSSCKKALPFA